MIHKTRGIVLKTTSYGESSMIVQAFTEGFGLQSFLVNGVRKSRSRFSANLFQPLHLLEIVAYFKPTASLQRVREVRNQPAYLTIPLDIAKNTIALFLCEVLYKVLRQQAGEDSPLFEYIVHSLELLDHQEEGVSCFHLLFMMGLTRHLGFFPDTRELPARPARQGGPGQAEVPLLPYFDLLHGKFSEHRPPHPHYLEAPLSQRWDELSRFTFEDLPRLRLSQGEKQALLHAILEYYTLHIEGFGKVRSLEILQELFA